MSCRRFPLLFLTSNGERDFPPAFLRRCLRLHMDYPSLERLKEIVRSQLQLDQGTMQVADTLIEEFYRLQNQTRADLATDQLLNAVYIAYRQEPENREAFLDRLSKSLRKALFQPLT